MRTVGGPGFLLFSFFPLLFFSSSVLLGKIAIHSIPSWLNLKGLYACICMYVHEETTNSGSKKPPSLVKKFVMMVSAVLCLVLF